MAPADKKAFPGKDHQQEKDFSGDCPARAGQAAQASVVPGMGHNTTGIKQRVFPALYRQEEP